MNWEELRNKYPVVRDKVYLMNASIAGMHEEVIASAREWLDFMSQQGGARDHCYFEILQECHGVMAEYFQVSPDAVGIGQNTSTNMNILAMMLKKKSQKRRIVLPADEFPSSVLPWYQHGFEVIQVASKQGIILPEDLLQECDQHTAAVVCSGVQFLTGYQIDIQKLGSGLKRKNIPFVLNATQMLGQSPIDLAAAHVSAMSASTHKWLGAGIGVAPFYLSDDFRDPLLYPMSSWASVEEPWTLNNAPQKLRSDAAALEMGSMPFINVGALCSAFKVLQKIGINHIRERIIELSDYLVEGLNDLPVTINSPRNHLNYKSGIINFSPAAGPDAEELVRKLKEKNIFVNTRRGQVRASVSFYNNHADVNAFIGALRECF